MAEKEIKIGAKVTGVSDVASGLKKIQKEILGVASAYQKMQAATKALSVVSPQQQIQETTVSKPTTKQSISKPTKTTKQQKEQEYKADISGVKKIAQVVDISPITKALDSSIKTLSERIEKVAKHIATPETEQSVRIAPMVGTPKLDMSKRETGKIVQARRTVEQDMDDYFLDRLNTLSALFRNIGSDVKVGYGMSLQPKFQETLNKVTPNLDTLIQKVEAEEHKEVDKLATPPVDYNMTIGEANAFYNNIRERVRELSELRISLSTLKESVAGLDIGSDVVTKPKDSKDLSILLKEVQDVYEKIIVFKESLFSKEGLIGISQTVDSAIKQLDNNIINIGKEVDKFVTKVEKKVVTPKFGQEISDSLKVRRKVSQGDVLSYASELGMEDVLPTETNEQIKELQERREKLFNSIVRKERENRKGIRDAIKTGTLDEIKVHDTREIVNEYNRVTFALIDWDKILDNIMAKLPQQLRDLLKGLSILQGDARQTLKSLGAFSGVSADELQYPLKGAKIKQRLEYGKKTHVSDLMKPELPHIGKPVISLPTHLEVGVDVAKQEQEIYASTLHELTHFFGVNRETINEFLSEESNRLAAITNVLKRIDVIRRSEQRGVTDVGVVSKNVTELQNAVQKVRNDNVLATLFSREIEQAEAFSSAELDAFSKGEKLPKILGDNLGSLGEKIAEKVKNIESEILKQVQKLLTARMIAEEKGVPIIVSGAEEDKDGIKPDVGSGRVLPTKDIEHKVQQVEAELLKLGVSAEVAAKIVEDKFRDKSKAALGLLLILKKIQEEEEKSPGFREKVFERSTDLEALAKPGVFESIIAKTTTLTEGEFKKRRDEVLDIGKSYKVVVETAERLQKVHAKQPALFMKSFTEFAPQLGADDVGVDARESLRRFSEGVVASSKSQDIAERFFKGLSAESLNQAMTFLHTLNKTVEAEERLVEVEAEKEKRLTKIQDLRERLIKLRSQDADLAAQVVPSGGSIESMVDDEFLEKEESLKRAEKEYSGTVFERKRKGAIKDAERERARILALMQSTDVAPAGVMSGKVGFTQEELKGLDISSDEGRDQLKLFSKATDKFLKDGGTLIEPRVIGAKKEKIAHDILDAKEAIPEEYLTVEMRVSTDQMMAQSRLSLSTLLIEIKNLKRKLEREGKIIVPVKQAEIDKASIDKQAILRQVRDARIATEGQLLEKLGVSEEEVVKIDVRTREGIEEVRRLSVEIKKVQGVEAIDLVPRESQREVQSAVRKVIEAREQIPIDKRSLTTGFLSEEELGTLSLKQLNLILRETLELYKQLEREKKLMFEDVSLQQSVKDKDKILATLQDSRFGRQDKIEAAIGTDVADIAQIDVGTVGGREKIAELKSLLREELGEETFDIAFNIPRQEINKIIERIQKLKAGVPHDMLTFELSLSAEDLRSWSTDIGVFNALLKRAQDVRSVAVTQGRIEKEVKPVDREKVLSKHESFLAMKGVEESEAVSYLVELRELEGEALLKAVNAQRVKVERTIQERKETERIAKETARERKEREREESRIAKLKEHYKKAMLKAGYSEEDIIRELTALDGKRGKETEKQVLTSIDAVDNEAKRLKTINKLSKELIALPRAEEYVKQKAGVLIPAYIQPPPPTPPTDGSVPAFTPEPDDHSKWVQRLSGLSDEDLSKLSVAVDIHKRMEGATYRNRLEQDRIANVLRRYGTMALATFGALIREAVKFNITLTQLTTAYNLTNNQAMQLVGLAEATGLSIDKLSSGIDDYYNKMLTAGMGTSLLSGRIRESLATMGLSSARLGEHGMGTVGMLDKMRRAFQDLKNPQDKAYLGAMVFGDKFKEFLPLLEMGDAAFARITTRFSSFTSLTGGDIRQAMIDSNAEIRAMVLSMRFLGQQFVTSLSPQIEMLSGKLEVFIHLIRSLPEPVTNTGVRIGAAAGVFAVFTASVLQGLTVLGRLGDMLARGGVLAQVFGKVLLGLKAFAIGAGVWIAAIAVAIGAIGYAIWKTTRENNEYNKTIKDTNELHKELEGLRFKHITSLYAEQRAKSNLTKRDRSYLVKAEQSIKRTIELEERREKLMKDLESGGYSRTSNDIMKIDDDSKYQFSWAARNLFNRTFLAEANAHINEINKMIADSHSKSYGMLTLIAKDYGSISVNVMAETFNEFERIMADTTVDIEHKVERIQAAFNSWATFNQEFGISIEKETKEYATAIRKILDDVVNKIQQLHEELKSPFEGSDASQYIKTLSSIRKGTLRQLRDQEKGFAVYKKKEEEINQWREKNIKERESTLSKQRDQVFVTFKSKMPKDAINLTAIDNLLKEEDYMQRAIIRDWLKEAGVPEKEVEDNAIVLMNELKDYENNIRQKQKAERELAYSKAEIRKTDIEREKNRIELITRIEREMSIAIRGMEHETFKVRSDIRKEFVQQVKGFVNELKEIESGLGVLPDIKLDILIDSKMLIERVQLAQREIANLQRATEDYIEAEKSAWSKDLKEGHINKLEFADKLRSLEIAALRNFEAQKSKILNDANKESYNASLELLKKYGNDSALTIFENIRQLQQLADVERSSWKERGLTVEQATQVLLLNFGKQQKLYNDYACGVIEAQNEIVQAKAKFEMEQRGNTSRGTQSWHAENMLRLQKVFAKDGKELTLDQQKSLVSIEENFYKARLSADKLSTSQRLDVLRDGASRIKALDSETFKSKETLVLAVQKLRDDLLKLEREISIKSPLQSIRDEFALYLEQQMDTLKDVKLEVFDKFVGMIDSFADALSSKPMEIGKFLNNMIKDMSTYLLKKKLMVQITHVTDVLAKQRVPFKEALGYAIKTAFADVPEIWDEAMDFRKGVHDVLAGGAGMSKSLAAFSSDALEQVVKKGRESSKHFSDFLNEPLPLSVRIAAHTEGMRTQIQDVMTELRIWLNKPENRLKLQVVPDVQKFFDVTSATTKQVLDDVNSAGGILAPAMNKLADETRSVATVFEEWSRQFAIPQSAMSIDSDSIGTNLDKNIDWSRINDWVSDQIDVTQQAPIGISPSQIVNNNVEINTVINAADGESVKRVWGDITRDVEDYRKGF